MLWRRDDPVDLNLLRTFVAVYETRSLTTAAGRLFVTQPAVSQGLARLRRELGDPLFERAGRALVPTPLAESLFPDIRDAIARIDRSLGTVHGFDPAASDRVFRIALSELGEIGYFPDILQAVRAEAPGIRVEVVPLEVARLPEWLARGTVDLAVSSSPVADDFEHVVLKSERYGVLMSPRHPLAAVGVSLDAYVRATHVVVAGDSGRPNLHAALQRIGARVDATVSVNRFATLPPLLSASTDLIATVPGTIGAGWASSWPLVVRDMPFAVASVDVSLYRRVTTTHVAALDWFHERVRRAIVGTPGQFFSIRAGAVTT
ncbi:LysR family transcriptional regulator [Microbacterium sp. LRZ72]|uniref:LysR family transcriptional regulator n=1 Tax=Microbacterium sp. LRZ72 TaxID=2942481 RepID=UPI0029A28314|nr:LysR substrate-binding domain-containing protein [Microbacterium sp. LRZ72]MDX2376100.1 LysR family transcriptional regulator [Microbacterium sp. LRZ72]